VTDDGAAGSAEEPSDDPGRAAGRSAGRPRDERATAAIVSAALRQLQQLGYARMSMETVAAEAGVSRATVYRRFRDKADLVTSAVATQVGPPAFSARPLADLEAFLEDFDAHLAEPCLEVVGCLLAAREDPTAMALHRQRVVGPRMVWARALLGQARDLGLLRPDADFDLLLHMLVGAVLARRVVGLPAERGWARRAVVAACRGVATPAGLDRLSERAGAVSRRSAARAAG
jgi:AcrR family transcriptional regulator